MFAQAVYQTRSSRIALIAAGTLSFALLTALGAGVRIPLPFSPVPLTLQTFFVLLSGALLGSKAGALSQFGYIALGASGLSIFANSGSGAAYLAGPTGGYIFGFVLAALVCGGLIRPGDGFGRVLAVFLLADLVLLSCGCLWLGLVTGMPFPRLLAAGLLVFFPGDALKAAAAAGIFRSFKRFHNRLA